MDFNSFYQKFIRDYRDSKHQRQGQFFMNQLGEVNEELYRTIPSSIDPYYDDKRLNDALQWVSEKWTE